MAGVIVPFGLRIRRNDEVLIKKNFSRFGRPLNRKHLLTFFCINNSNTNSGAKIEWKFILSLFWKKENIRSQKNPFILSAPFVVGRYSTSYAMELSGWYREKKGETLLDVETNGGKGVQRSKQNLVWYETIGAVKSSVESWRCWCPMSR